MIDISAQNLESALIQGSMQQPVLLDIWAPWCGPCKSLGPILEKLEQAYGGAFALAKLNSDAEPEIAGQLSQMFGVRSIPFCVMFVGGQPVDGFVGAIPEAQIREFLDKHVSALPPTEEEAEAATETDEGLDPAEAELAKLASAVEQKPDGETERGQYIQALLKFGHIEQAQSAFHPVRDRAQANVLLDKRLQAVEHWLNAYASQAQNPEVSVLQERIASNKRDFEARFALAQNLMTQQQFTAAMDELLEIIMREKAWNNELARKVYVAILEILTPVKTAPAPSASNKPASSLQLTGHATIEKSDPLVDQYRRKLSMALF